MGQRGTDKATRVKASANGGAHPGEVESLGMGQPAYSAPPGTANSK